MSEKKGMTSAMANAASHVAPTMPAQTAQPTSVLDVRCREFFGKMRKKMKREVTDWRGPVRTGTGVRTGAERARTE
jgi:hypothetical protein